MTHNYALSFLLQTYALNYFPESYLLALLKAVETMGNKIPNAIPPLFAQFVENFDPTPYPVELLKRFFAFTKIVPCSCKWLARVPDLNPLIVNAITLQLEESGPVALEFLSRFRLFSV